MKRIISAICAALLLLSLCACSKTSEKLDMFELQKCMVAADKTLPEMKISGSWDENAEKAFSYLSDLEYNKIHGFFLAYAADGMAYEIAVVQLKAKADAAELTESLRGHVETRAQMYRTYEPEQVQRAESASVETIGDCVLLIMSDAPDMARTAFNEFVK